MTIEDSVFARMRVSVSGLEPFGFVKEEDRYVYSADFMDGDFRAEVTVSADGAVSSRVIDNDSGEEYTAVHGEGRSGPFVSLVRDEYMELLSTIARECFTEMDFVADQSNRIAGLVFHRYGELPDHPFERDNAGVFRYPENRKWYGIIMNVPKGKIKNADGDPLEAGSEELIEVLNLKIDPERYGELLSVPGILPSYHMNRNNWISILMDDTVPDELVMELIDCSRGFAVSAGGRTRPKAGVRTWIVPANPKYFDIRRAFRENEEIIWKQSSAVQKGDIVYIYVAAPVSAVLYKCVVTQADIPYEHRGEIKIDRVMRVRKLMEFDERALPFSRLRELGINAVRGPRSVTEEFADHVAGLEK